MVDAMRFDWIGFIALIGALAILLIFALVDAYAVRACFALAHTGVAQTDLCAPEHLFRTALEIGGMAVGLYGAARLIRK
jgi:hypothetical protein